MSYELKQSDVFDFAAAQNCETRQKGDELEFRYCPYCDGGAHKDEWTFAVNLAGGMFKCLRASCSRQGHFVQLCRDFGYRLDFEPPKVYRQLQQKKPESKDEAVRYLKGRGISEEVTRRYHITVQKDNRNVLVFPFYDETGRLVSVKYRKMNFNRERDKAKEWFEKDTMPILFGMDQCRDFAKPLVITEGQIDSLSVAEAGIENAVSVPTGANGFTWLSNNYRWLVQFQEIIVFGDYERGKISLIDGLSARLPREIILKCVRPEDYLGEKDANDILRRFGPEAVRFCVENARVPKLDAVKNLSEVTEIDIYTMQTIRTGIPDLDFVIRGMALGQLVVLTGKRGEGKSTFMSQLVAEALNQGRTVFVYSGELTDSQFKRCLDFQLAGSKHLLPYQDDFGGIGYLLSEEVRRSITQWYDDRAYIFDNNYIGDRDENELLLGSVEKAIQQYNVQLVCIDNLMTAMETVAENQSIYQAQSRFVGRLKQIAMKYNIVIVLVAHPRKAGANDTADDNDLVSGSSDITNKADIVLKYSRCEPAAYDCDSLIKVTKNRIMGTLRTKNENAIRVNYSPMTKRITGVTPGEQKEKIYGWEKTLSDDADPFGDLPF